MQQINKSSLQYLGEEYQFKLVKEFMEDRDCFKDLAPIIDQNMFTGQYLRMFVGTMLEYFKRHGSVPSYSSMSVELRQRAHTQADIEICEGVIKKIKNTPSDGSEQTRELATKFFKQQNIIKAANEMLRLAGNGDLDNYEKCEQLLRDALNTGTHEDYEESRLFDGMDETLSEDFRTVIPTGIGKIDETLNGGIGKGELGVIVGSSGFGKAVSIYEIVLTPDGFTMARNIKVGDMLIGRDGKPTKVLGVFPQGVRRMYDVLFNDGTKYTCDKEHILPVYVNGEYKCMTLGEIMSDGLLAEDGSLKYESPICDAVEFNDNNLKGDPFKVGCSFDVESPDAYIAPEYLYSTIENRKRLLEGLLTKAQVLEDGSYSFHTMNYLSGYYVATVARSLGYFASEIYYDGWRIDIQKGVRKCISAIKERDEEEAVCFYVDNDEHLFLTRDYNVTHNTTMTTSMALHAAGFKSEQNDYHGFKVMQIVFEDRIKQIQRKHFSKITQVEACNLSKEEYSQYVRNILENYEDRELIQENLRIIRLKSGEKSIEFIGELIRKHINNGFRPDIVMLDYFECIKLTGSSTTSKWDKESAIMRKIEAMANELNIAFWVSVQGNRDSINAELVTMDNAGGSLGKIQIAHIIMSITRSLEDIADNIATIAILKNRAGSSGRVIDGAVFNNGTCTISTDNVEDFGNTFEFGKQRDKKKEESERDLTREIFQSTKKK